MNVRVLIATIAALMTLIFHEANATGFTAKQLYDGLNNQEPISLGWAYGAAESFIFLDTLDGGNKQTPRMICFDSYNLADPSAALLNAIKLNYQKMVEPEHKSATVLIYGALINSFPCK